MNKELSLNSLLAEFIFSSWERPLQELAHFQGELLADKILITLTLPFAWYHQAELEAELAAYLSPHYSFETLELVLNFNISARKAQVAEGVAGVSKVKNIIAVSSAKGGVGKSTVTVNLAHALAACGLRVGILDADIYGPSIPHMMGAEDDKPTSPDNKTMNPVEVKGLYCNSIGFLVPETDPTIWRGPVASTMLKQLMSETNWSDLDYLLIDMPPGTGDIQITTAQNLSLTGALVVSTPQEVALLDVVKGINMFNDLKIPVLGLVENMSVFHCPHCEQETKLYAYDGIQEIAKVLNLPVFATLPLNPQVAKDLDNGRATTYDAPEAQISQHFFTIAERMAYRLYRTTKSATPAIAIKSL